MAPPASKNLAAFQQLARRATTRHSSSSNESIHKVGQHGPHSKHNLSAKNVSSGNRSASGTNIPSGSNLGSQDDLSSGDNSELEFHRGDKKKGLVYQKTENFITRIRDMIAQADVFIVRSESPPFVACLQVSVWFIPILVILLLWDTLAVLAFQIPHLSFQNHPCFILGWHFVMLTLAMYGYMLSYLSSGNSPRTSLAGISLGIHYLLMFYRIFMELFFDGYRGQDKLYVEKTSRPS